MAPQALKCPIEGHMEEPENPIESSPISATVYILQLPLWQYYSISSDFDFLQWVEVDKLLGICEDAVHDGAQGCFTERQFSICPMVPNDLARTDCKQFWNVLTKKLLLSLLETKAPCNHAINQKVL